jgi:hypothetical protein
VTSVATRDGVSVTKSVKLLWVDCIEVKATLKQRFDDCSMGSFGGNGNRLGSIPAEFDQPIGKLKDRRRGVLNLLLGNDCAVNAHDTTIMLAAAAVDADEELILVVGIHTLNS